MHSDGKFGKFMKFLSHQIINAVMLLLLNVVHLKIKQEKCTYYACKNIV